MDFFVRCKCKFRRFTGGKSRNLHAADGGKDSASRAAELCGGALNFPAADAFDRLFRLFQRVERGQAEVTLAARSEARTRRAHDVAFIQQTVKELSLIHI